MVGEGGTDAIAGGRIPRGTALLLCGKERGDGAWEMRNFDDEDGRFNAGDCDGEGDDELLELDGEVGRVVGTPKVAMESFSLVIDWLPSSRLQDNRITLA